VIVEHPVPEEDLARMASLFNVDRVDRLPEGYLDNVRLHFPDECGRHKLLDLLGDFSLAGRRIKGHVIADKSGHRINTIVAGILREQILKTYNN
ncbi:MAG TPA: UDP-3-O-acyl-N-acetylglucosamine deacetylase, partial [Candidatus Coprenecus stercoravium]|nr:UDP-3-O-acyl-N-acetylglucosamine deacetylase [Candidatus Coprenecus stercoravium]